MRKRQIYAIYKGEENLADGTADELAKKLGKSVKQIYLMATKRYHKKHDRGNRMIAIKIGKEKIN